MILNGSARVLLNLKKAQQAIPKNVSRFTKKTGNVKYNKSITVIQFVQYYLINYSLRSQYQDMRTSRLGTPGDLT
jgi:hypothetical protein